MTDDGATEARLTYTPRRNIDVITERTVSKEQIRANLLESSRRVREMVRDAEMVGDEDHLAKAIAHEKAFQAYAAVVEAAMALKTEDGVKDAWLACHKAHAAVDEAWLALTGNRLDDGMRRQ